MKAIFNKSIVNIKLNGETLKTIPINYEQGKVVYFLHIFQYSTWNFTKEIRQLNESKRIQIRKEEVKGSLFV